MTIKEARKIEKEFYETSNPSEEQEFIFIEAMEFLINENKDPHDMMSLGGHYYGQKKFDLALKYYEMAAGYDIDAADECLGYIWYYGRTGERDYKKAFHHFKVSMERGNLVSAYKVADMYKNGYYVRQDYREYKEIIERLYPKVQSARYLNEPLPEIYTRLARIRVEQDRIDEAIELYQSAKDFLAQRISYNSFFGNLNIMKWLVADLYMLIEFDNDDFDLFDLYHLLENPVKVEFVYNGRVQKLEASTEEGHSVIHFNDKWYRTVDDFFGYACIDGEKLTSLYQDLYDFEVVK